MAGALRMRMTVSVLMMLIIHYQLVGALCRSGVEESRLAVISLYRQQNKLLAHLLQAHKDLEIMTADKSQGRDKDCIIISMVRSNEIGNVSSSYSRQYLDCSHFLEPVIRREIC